MSEVLDIQEFCALSSTRLAELTGIAPVTWGNIFSGKQRPSLGTLYKTAKALGWTEEKVITAIARRQQISLMNQDTLKKG